MKWREVREIYPNQFVKLMILKSHVENGNEIVDEVGIIKPIDEENATKELLSLKDNTLVYHTSHTEMILKIRSRIGVRRAVSFN